MFYISSTITGFAVALSIARLSTSEQTAYQATCKG